MAVEKTKAGERDRSNVNIRESDEVVYSAMKWMVIAEQMKNTAVRLDRWLRTYPEL
jgi:hypothetical protein